MNTFLKSLIAFILFSTSIHIQAEEVDQFKNWATCYSLTSAIRETNGEFWPGFKNGLERVTVNWKKAAIISLMIHKKKSKFDAEKTLISFENAYVQEAKSKKKTEMDLLVDMGQQCKSERIAEADNYVKTHKDVLAK